MQNDFGTLHEYFMMQNRPNLFPTNNLTKFCKHQGQISNVCLQFWVAKFKYLLADKKNLEFIFSQSLHIFCKQTAQPLLNLITQPLYGAKIQICNFDLSIKVVPRSKTF